MPSDIKDLSSLLFLPFSHFSIILPLYLTLIAAAFLLPTTTHLLSARRTALFIFTGDTA